MDFTEARSELKQLLSRVVPAELPKLLHWISHSDELDELLLDNRTVTLRSIADDLRAGLPLDAMLPSETAAHHKMQQQPRPTVHVDGFLYDDEQVDSLCEDGTMSRTYCLSCGSHKTAALDFISHSFSVSELQFLFQNVLPDLSGRTLVDVGSRLGAVLYGGYVYSSASQLLGLELSDDFVRLQNNMLHKYRLNDRVQVLQADVRTQDILLQNADVLVMNNVFEYFMEPNEQVNPRPVDAELREMPLLHRRAFVRQRPPADLRPDEEVFLCTITHEVFRTYDEFFERTILCNSLVWSCALTGRAGLTYLEAVESERRAKHSLQNFPQSLVVPLLHLVALSRHCRLTELCDEVHAFVKDRFFPGESVDVMGPNGARHVCEILQVQSAHSSANGVPNANGRPKSGDAIVITDSDDESNAFQSPKAQVNGRRKTTLSREKLKLLLKQHCEPQNGTIVLKAAQEKRKLLQQREEMAAAAQDRARLKKEKEEAQEAKRRERGDKEKMKEEQRRRFEEEKQRRREEKESRKLEREREREKLKEEKKKYAERLKLWNKPREDMECEDLKELPSPVPVRTRLPSDLFGDALMVLEFLRAFGEAFDLKDEFPDGISLEVLEEALVGSDPEGPLCELLFFFLSAIFQALDEEQEESALSAIASLAASWPQLHQGCGLKRLDLDSCTLSEILRLHILASGAHCNHGNAKLRYQKQGGFTPMDDPCVELRLAEPALLKRLSCTAVYDLTPGEKLRLLQALVGKLLTLASSRDLIEDCVEEQRAARQELRETRAEQHRRDREEAAHRVRVRREEKLREQEQRLKEKEEKLKGRVQRLSSLSTEEMEVEQEKVQELQERIHKAAACTCLLPLGRDRLYRRYWLLPSAAALFVEDDAFGLTEDMLEPSPKPAQDATTMMEDEAVVKEEPAEGRSVPECTAAAETLMEVRLRDLLLDIEDRIHQGTLGTLKVMDRQVWRSALEAGNYELLSSEGRENGGMNGRVEAGDPVSSQLRARDRLQELKSDGAACGTSGSGTPQVVSSCVRILAQALAHIEQGIERRFLKAPLGEDDPKKDQKTKKSKKKDEDQASDDGSDGGRVMKTVLERWRESLQSCSSLSQVFVHLSSLERSVLWSRSVLNARCRICRRKGDADNMLLCDGCDRGHHTHCLRPRLKSVPEGDWFCPDCRPKQSTKKHQALLPKGKNEQTTPPKGKNQQITPKSNAVSGGKTSSASKSSGKKAMPPPSKSNVASGSRAAPPRSAGSRSSARLSHEILAPPSGSTKTSPGQSEGRKRAVTDATPPPKPSRPVLSPAAASSSSSRRSSGRNHGVHELSACEQLTVELVPDYYDIIKKPIALSTIRERVNNCEYQTAGEFVCDVELMFSNCLQYNPRHTNEAKAGLRLQHFFHSELDRLGLSERGPAPPAKRSRH
ncbi:hypothetical protein F2P81_002936 [Scophthalmus maximus]|uniref:Bromodomain adjacent to zinc finger domain protein 1A n=1 Tax=Scophthalmus maximus TaxID=52904 RepID=A0A6A4TH47_SCOMX|nr:hypothetical protein F2P81_002936 [Scophthalmus maximus]